MPDLKPCPFCGSENLLTSVHMVSGLFSVACDKCGAHGPRVQERPGGPTDVFDPAYPKVQAWNCRTHASTDTNSVLINAELVASTDGLAERLEEWADTLQSVFDRHSDDPEFSSMPASERNASAAQGIKDLREAADRLRSEGERTKQRAFVGCAGCNRPYSDPGFMDLIVPDDIWSQISPTGDEGGLLCPGCIISAMIDADQVGEVVFRSGPLNGQHLTLHTQEDETLEARRLRLETAVSDDLTDEELLEDLMNTMDDVSAVITEELAQEDEDG